MRHYIWRRKLRDGDAELDVRKNRCRSHPGVPLPEGSFWQHPAESKRRSKSYISTWLYRERNLIERFFAKLKHFRRVAIRYDNLAESVFAVVQLASMRLLVQRRAWAKGHQTAHSGNKSLSLPIKYAKWRRKQCNRIEIMHGHLKASRHVRGYRVLNSLRLMIAQAEGRGACPQSST